MNGSDRYEEARATATVELCSVLG
ncbi:hypothetical protein NSND_61044 [Nitrospira sp. ND1]|nr:hypothetical protein NSND_61044 [Nitrospira sp. ND1]